MKQAFAYSFQGASHIKKEENLYNNGRKFPCQDRSFSGDFEASDVTEKTEVTLFVKDRNNSSSQVLLPVELNPHKASFSLICVSDGHGGNIHFRSQKGAEFAIQTSIELLSESIDKIVIALQEKTYPKINKNLSKAFVRRWIRKIMDDLLFENKDELLAQIEDLEKDDAKTAKTYKDELKTAYSLVERYNSLCKNPLPETEENTELSSVINEFAKLEIKDMYGCTVVVYFQIKNSPLWYAFKIGDSDFLASFGGNFVKPIADDPQCYENITTSLCNGNAIQNFRFPDEKYLQCIPENIFLSSDGVANSFANEEYLTKFYKSIIFSYDEDGPLHSENEIKEKLPQLSLKGSGDDITLAGIISYDDRMEAKQERRQNVKERAAKYINDKKYQLIYPIFKPYLDRNESDFKYLIAVYDYKETIELSKFPLNKNFLMQWNKTFLSLNAVINDINLSEKSKTMEKAIQNLHKIMETAISNDIRNTTGIKTQDDIDEFFSSFITSEVNLYTYYKVVYEYKWLKKCFEVGYLTEFNNMFTKAESDLLLFARTSNFNFVNNTRGTASKYLSDMYGMKSKYWAIQK